MRGEDPLAPACRCGVTVKPQSTVYGKDDGRCYRHPERGTDAWRPRARKEHGCVPDLPIAPILESFGGQPVAEGLGWKPYRCPFHKDSDASGSINTTLQVYNCHADECPKGSAVQVLMKHEGISYAEAVKRAKEIVGGNDTSVRSPRGRGRGLARESGSKSGVRTFRRSWRSD